MVKNENFYHFNDFFYIVIKTNITILYVNVVDCQSIDKLQNQIGRSDQPSFISKIKYNILEIFYFHFISETVSHKITIIMRYIYQQFQAMRAKKKEVVVIGSRKYNIVEVHILI